MEGGFVPWLLQQFAIAYESNTARIVTDHGIGNDCQLGKERGRQIERRYELLSLKEKYTNKCP